MKKNSTILLIVAFAAFTTLAIPTAVLGVAWERMHVELGVPLDGLGLLLLAGTGGFSVASLFSARVVTSLGLGRTLLLSSGLMLLTLAGFAAAPGWIAVLAAGLTSGLTAGLTDASLNMYVATNHSARVTNWLHGFFGVGATLGPLIMTSAFALDRSWRVGYAVAAAIQIPILAVVVATQPRWKQVRLQADDESGNEGGSSAASPIWKHPLVWLGAALFFLYTGNEMAAGQWAFTLLHRARGVAETTAGVWVSVYWGSLTVGRFLFGAIAERVGVWRLLRGTIFTVFVGSLLLWLDFHPTLSSVGLALMGFANAPIFPLLISTTPARVGDRLAVRTVGLQVAAAGAGGAVLPGVAGILADDVGLETIAIFLVVASLAQVVLYEATRAPSN